MSGRNNPLHFFVVLSLLAMTPPQSLDKGLQSLALALDATSKSVGNVKKGMDTLQSGLQLMTFLGSEGAGKQQTDDSGRVEKQPGGTAKVMPAAKTGWEGNKNNKSQDHVKSPDHGN